jgi:hypothetical protein
LTRRIPRQVETLIRHVDAPRGQLAAPTPRNPKPGEALKLACPSNARSQHQLHAIVLRRTAGKIRAGIFLRQQPAFSRRRYDSARLGAENGRAIIPLKSFREIAAKI